jgi:hypothetical protein
MPSTLLEYRATAAKPRVLTSSVISLARSKTSFGMPGLGLFLNCSGVCTDKTSCPALKRRMKQIPLCEGHPFLCSPSSSPVLTQPLELSHYLNVCNANAFAHGICGLFLFLLRINPLAIQPRRLAVKDRRLWRGLFDLNNSPGKKPWEKP